MKLIGFSAMEIADKLNERGILSPYEYKKSIGINFSPGFKKNALSTDLRDGIINEEQYQKYSKVYDDKLQKLDKSVHSQEKLTKDIYENGAQAEDRLKRFKKFLNIDKLDRMALVTFVDRIFLRIKQFRLFLNTRMNLIKQK